MSYTPLATSTAATSATTIASTGQTFQITGNPVTMAGKVITKLPLPANSKIVAVNVPATQGGKGSNRTEVEFTFARSCCRHPPSPLHWFQLSGVTFCVAHSATHHT